uniref:Calx-beta domain-containing protein n=2 Tax=Octactis speculum TaxID=3111310 RepID=A0A7S2H6C6_9STRA
MHLGAPKVTVTIACKGHTTEQAVAYTTQDGTAKAGIDFTAASGKLVFAPGTESLEVDLVGNSSGNPGNFEVILTDTTDDPGETGGGGCSSKDKDGILAGATVSILPVSDDDHAGVFSFGAASYEVCESEKTTSVAVERTGGLHGDVTVHFTTRDETATGSIDYGVVDEILTFKHGEMVKMVVLDIVDDESYEKEETFQCVLSDPTGGSTLNSQTDGGAEAEITVVHIMSDETQKKFTDSILLLMNVNRDRVKIGHNNWKSQFVAAITVNGGADGVVQPSEWALHLIALPWKLFFAMIPPTDFAGGWVCFGVALIFIGFVTALIGDMAALLGCVVGMKASTTAITFVALGTSLPDTFASMASAKMDRYADNSLGNVTGSNSVNVFLGLGLPWLIAAIYWDNASGATLEAWRGKYSEELPEVVEKFKHGVFVVPAGSLGVSVTTFVVTATVCLLTLGLRRFVVGGELGGPATSKYATSVFFVFMWLAYIVVSVTA